MTPRHFRLTKRFLLPASLLLPLAGTIAADVFWDNPGTGLFNDGANWDTGIIPTAADNAFLIDGGTAQLGVDEFAAVNTLRVQSGAVELESSIFVTGVTSSTWQSAGDMQIGGIAGMNGSLTASGASVITTGRVRIGGWNEAGVDQSDMHGSLTMSGSSSLTSDTGGFDFWLGNGAGSTASLNMSGSSVIDIKQSGGTAARAGAEATVVQTGTSQFKTRDTFWIGEGGTATWDVQESATLQSTNGAFVLGQGPGGSATLNVSGGTVSTGDNLVVGDRQGGDAEVNLSGGTVTVGNEFQIGNDGGNGTVNLSGGQLTVANWVGLGRHGTGTGTVTVSGTGEFNHTATRDANSHLIVGDQANGILNVQGGSVTSSKTIWIGGGATGVGTVNMSGGNLTATGSDIVVGLDAGAQAALNLNGGTVTANAIVEQNGTGTVNFNGGTLRAGAASADFIAGFEAGDVVIQSGGAVIDTNAFNVQITLALTGDGGLAKIGEGTLILSGANTYLGNTAVTGGVLSITSGFLSDSGNIFVEGVSGEGAVFDLNFEGTDTVNGLVINGEIMPVGTWGAVDSGATFESEFFSGNGILEVTAAVPEPSTVALVTAGLGMGAWSLRRRRR